MDFPSLVLPRERAAAVTPSARVQPTPIRTVAEARRGEDRTGQDRTGGYAAVSNRLSRTLIGAALHRRLCQTTRREAVAMECAAAGDGIRGNTVHPESSTRRFEPNYRPPPRAMRMTGVALVFDDGMTGSGRPRRS